VAKKKKAAKKKAGKKKAAKKKAPAKKKAAAKKKKAPAKKKKAAAAVEDDLVAPKKKKNGKGKIAIIRRSYREGAEKGIGFARTVWSDIWEKRILRDFALKSNMKTTGVILTHPEAIALHRFVYGWKAGERSFPKRDYARCLNVDFDAEGHLLDRGDNCPACTFFGKPAMIALAFAIGDLRRQFDKDGNEIPWAVKRILLQNFTIRDAILQAVELAAARERREEEIAGSVFQITRGQGRQVVRIGDVWVYEKFANVEGATFQKMLALVPDWKEEYPYLDEKLIKEMCQIHMRVGAEHPLDQGDMWDNDGAQEIFGASGTTKAKVSSAAKEEEKPAEEDDLMGPSAGTSKGPALSEMEDIEEEEEADEATEEEEEEVEVVVGTEVTFVDDDEGELTGKVTKIDGDEYTVDVEDEGEIYEYVKSIDELTVVEEEEEEEEEGTEEEEDEDDDLPFPEEDL
jgi:hypothetical protein